MNSKKPLMQYKKQLEYIQRPFKEAMKIVILQFQTRHQNSLLPLIIIRTISPPPKIKNKEFTDNISISNTLLSLPEGVWTGLDGERVGGHAFVLTGYKPFYKIASNSYGDTWGKFNDGTFLIKNEDVEDLGTCYILYDHKDLKYIFKESQK